MAVITGVVPLLRQPGRFEIRVEGKPFAMLSAEAIERLQISVGLEVAPLHAAIGREAERLRVYDRAVNMLAFRDRSSAELGRALIRKGELREQVERALRRLGEAGLLDDARFAASFVRAKVLGARQSRRRVQQSLARKGVAREISDAAIAAVFEDEQVDQDAIVEEAARKKMRLLRRLEPAVRRRRLYAFLARRGYDGSDIRRAMALVDGELRAPLADGSTRHLA